MSKPATKKVGQLYKCTKPFWREPTPIVQIEMRSKKNFSRLFPTYFVRRPQDSVGYGTWVHDKDLIEISPLERLAMCSDD